MPRAGIELETYKQVQSCQTNVFSPRYQLNTCLHVRIFNNNSRPGSWTWYSVNGVILDDHNWNKFVYWMQCKPNKINETNLFFLLFSYQYLIPKKKHPYIINTIIHIYKDKTVHGDTKCFHSLVWKWWNATFLIVDK